MNFGKYINFGESPYEGDLSDLMQTGLENYLCHGLEPGGFLTSVLANDLMAASCKADHWNKTRLVPIAKWVLHNAPQGSWGSYDAVRDWCANTDLRRSEWFGPIEKNFVWEQLQA